MSENNDPPRGKKGGEARAAKLSKQELSEAASLAARSRWAKEKGDVPKTEFTGTILIGTQEIDCAVVEIGGEAVRLLSERSVTKALGGKRGGSHWRRLKQNPDGANLPLYVSAKNLGAFISSDLQVALTSPIQYLTKSGAVANGVRADVFPQILWVYQEATLAGKLLPSQAHMGIEAKILLKALTNLSVTALIDEATGYQSHRQKDALAKILQQYVMNEYQRWNACFPLKFYEEMFRLRGWEWTEKAIAGARPSVVGKYTDDIVYDRLAPGVLDELRRKNPTVAPGKRKQKHYYWLSGEVGHPKLISHLEGAWLLMKQSKTWDELKDKLDEWYPIHHLTENGMELHVKRKKIGGKR